VSRPERVSPRPGPLPEAEGLYTEGKTAEVPDVKMPSWESQAAQYSKTGPPGISYFRGHVTADYYVDCLLYRDEDGELVGILNHYPADYPPYEREGSGNIWVHPDRRRQGIGTELVLESMRRWEPLEPKDVRYSEAGLEWATALASKIAGTDLDFRTEGWEAWHDRINHDRIRKEGRHP